MGKNDSSFPQTITRGGTTRIIMPSNKPPFASEKSKKEKIPQEKDGLTFGVVYANDLAASEIEKDNPQFSAGSVIVREKRLSAASEMPETVIAMVKREKNFSEKTGDWEFFVFDGKSLKLNSRETKGSCSQCHSKAKENDWVFLHSVKNKN